MVLVDFRVWMGKGIYLPLLQMLNVTQKPHATRDIFQVILDKINEINVLIG